jgi:hypothetical protein
MSFGFESEETTLHKLRERLQAMPDEEFGVAIRVFGAEPKPGHLK